MRTFRIIIMWASIFLIILLRNGYSDNFQWTSVVPFTYELCGVKQDCSGSGNNLDGEKSRRKNICCKGCLCGDGCLENERVEKQYTGLTKCLNPVEDDRVHVRYRFIIKEPKDGCVIYERSMKKIKPSCQSEVEAAPWGNFYPVYSFDKRANFKNEQCALCHGAINTIKWNVYAFYWGKDYQRIGIFRKFYRDFNSSDMIMAFYPPNEESWKYEHVCHYIQDDCSASMRDTFYIPHSVNMTREQVVQACKEGIMSPYIYSAYSVYKNLFCAICSGRVSRESDSLICDEDVINTDDNMKGVGQSFASLIDQKFIESNLEERNGVKTVQMACLIRTAGEIVKKTCREVLCPALQVRQHDGTCRYPMNKIFTTRFTVNLNLTTTNIIDAQRIQNTTNTDLEILLKRSMPWPRHWELIEVFRRTDTLHTNLSELYVSIGYKNANFLDIAYLRRLIIATLSRNWTIDFGQPYAFKQSFHKHGLFKRSKNYALLKPKWAMRPGINDIFLNLSSPTWEAVVVNSKEFYYSPPGEPLEITNLYFCDQIEMNAEEFVWSTSEFPLLLKRSGTVLYPSQFYINEGENKSQSIHVCIEDTDFKLVQNTNDGSHLEMSAKILLFLLQSILLIRLHLFNDRFY